MPGRRNRSSGPGTAAQPATDPLAGFNSEHHGQRSQLEEIMAGGGSPGGGMGGVNVGQGGGAGGPAAGPAQPMPSVPPTPFSNPFFDDQGGIIPSDPNAQPPQDPILPDDPDIFLRMMMRYHPHPDIVRLLEGRSQDLYQGTDLGPGPALQQSPVDTAPDPLDPMAGGMAGGVDFPGLGPDEAVMGDPAQHGPGPVTDPDPATADPASPEIA